MARVKALTQLPGVGTLTALVLVAEIGDVTRFPSARKLAAWAGLTPTVRGSDLTVRHGHISKQGSDWLRWILCVRFPRDAECVDRGSDGTHERNIDDGCSQEVLAGVA
ncbi:transposase [Streptomyces mirabilis]|uniref:transposase n=1 Tax=Streptomyces mirabilis TaxID=68239 RepID=UPI0036C0F12A